MQRADSGPTARDVCSGPELGRINLAVCADMSIRGVKSGLDRVLTADFTLV